MTACTILQTDPYPIYEIDLAQLDTAVEVSGILRDFGTVNYVYTFRYHDIVIKHGISVDKKSIPGERIYRQAGHLLGWGRQLASGSAGNDMRLIDYKYYLNTGKNLNRQGMTITVHDLTKVKSPSMIDRHLHVKQLERQLIREYEQTHGRLPIGNVKDESYIDRRTCVTKATFERLFEFD